MASLTKTYTRDLSTAIAGKLWEAIKDADERRELEKSKASEEVKQAAIKLKKDDSNSLPVQDKDLGKTITKIFVPVEGKLLQTEGKVENLSGKITAVAGSIADTQKLIINQNEILEDKFDQLLKVVGNKSAIQRAKEAESKFEQLELDMEKGLDLSGTFEAEKTTSGLGIYGKILTTLLGNHFTVRILKNLTQSLLPVGLRSRARLLRKSVLPAKKFATKLTGGKSFSRNILKSVLKPITMGFTGSSFRALGKAMLGTKWSRSTLQGKVLRHATMRLLGKSYPQFMADQILKFNKKWTSEMGMEAMGRAVAGETSQRAIAGVTVKNLNKQMSEGVFSAAMKSSRVQAALLEKLGAEGFEQLTVKFGTGTVKGGFPIAGSLYAAAEGLVRLSPAFGGSDWKGALLSMGSGLPIAGWGFTAIDILRDIDVDAYTSHIEGKFPPSEEDIANFFMDALGISPAQYERGNISIKPPTSGVGPSASAISNILGVTKAFGDATGFSGEVQGQIDAANLGSYPIPRANYTFDVGGRSAMRGFDKQAQAEERKELSLIRKRPEFPDDPDDDEEDKEEQKIQDSRWLTDPRRHFDFGNKPGKGGIGGDNNVKARTPIMGGDGATIEFWGQQGRDLSGEPGVDFSYKDYKSNYNLFPGYVLETGLLYGDRYGNVVVVRSVDPSNGLEFDSLYSHFPDGGIAVKPGQVVSAGEYLGKVGFVSVDVPGVPQMQPNNAGNMSGWHTSVDFFEPGSAARYRNLSAIQSLVTGANGQSPVGLLEKLKPPVKNEEQSSLNNIEANSKLGSAMTGLVENGSMDRKLTQKKIASRLPIVIVNNQVIRSNSNPIVVNKSNNVDGDFFDAYNLAKFSV